MIKTDICILGINPHSIGLCLLAKHYGLSTVLVDQHPLHNYPLSEPWLNQPRLEPISIDAISGLNVPELEEYKLSRFLNLPDIDIDSLEECNDYCTIKQFNAYVHTLLSKLESSGYVEVIKDGIETISNKYLITQKGERISSIANVICTDSKYREPYYSEFQQHKYTNVINPYKESIEDIENKKVLILGSEEEHLASLVYLAQKGNHIIWSLSKPYKVSKFDIPSIYEWGDKSALGPYFRDNVKDITLRMRYIQSAMNWGPSITNTYESLITPLIEEGLIQVIYEPNSNTSSIREYGSIVDHILICTNTPIYIRDIPYLHKPLEHPKNPLYPLLNEDLSDSNGIYYSGHLATLEDGLRQTSLISSGITAGHILEQIVSKYNDR